MENINDLINGIKKAAQNSVYSSDGKRFFGKLIVSFNDGKVVVMEKRETIK